MRMLTRFLAGAVVAALSGVAAALPGQTAAIASPGKHTTVKPIRRWADPASQHRYFRSLGHKRRGGVDRATVKAANQSFPYFSSSFIAGGVSYPYTMVGYAPDTGLPAAIQSVIIPLRINFANFGEFQNISRTFDPDAAVANIIASPIYQSAQYPNGYGQFGDQMQRAAFWNRMDSGHNWHVQMDTPGITPTLDIYLTPENGTLSQDAAGNTFGDVPIDLMDLLARGSLQFMDLAPEVLPIFVTSGVTAEALGYHNAFVLDDGGDTQVQTYVYTSWLDPTQVSPLFADVSTFNHELAEWLNDPFVNNVVPLWMFPPSSDPNTFCADNKLLEVGDPQGNGPTFSDYPTFPVVLGGVTYHLQQLVLWQWFANETPSSAFQGWYTFPNTSSLTEPAVYC